MTVNLGQNYELDENADGDLVVIDRQTGQPVLKHDHGLDQFVDVSQFQSLTTDQASTADGSASDPAQDFQNDGDTGLYRKDSGVVGVSRDGSEFVTMGENFDNESPQRDFGTLRIRQESRGTDSEVKSMLPIHTGLLLESEDAHFVGLSEDEGGHSGAYILATGSDGTLTDEWSMGRLSPSGGSYLQFDYGTNTDWAQNDSVFSLAPNGNTRVHDGRLLIGDVSPVQGKFGVSPYLQVLGESVVEGSQTSAVYEASDGGPASYFLKSRGETVGDHGQVNSGDTALFIAAEASDGSNFQRAGSISVVVDGTPASGDMPGRIEFNTTQSGSGSTTEAIRIDSSQHLDFRTNATETADGMNKDPESGTEDAFITVKLNGTTYEIPAYATA